MKKYEKEYEDYFSSAVESDKCKPHLVNNTMGVEFKEYVNLLNENVFEHERDVFDKILKFEWLKSRFIYNEKPVLNLMTGRQSHTRELREGFEVLMRQYVGTDQLSIIASSSYKLVKSYILSFYPDYHILNPFRAKLEYPYKYMSFSCLRLMWSFGFNRLDYLDYGEKKKMTYAVFFDYMINHINCYNDEVGYEHYTIRWQGGRLPMIRKISKKKIYEEEKAKTSGVRPRK